jgi:hypothetical protein
MQYKQYTQMTRKGSQRVHQYAALCTAAALLSLRVSDMQDCRRVERCGPDPGCALCFPPAATLALLQLCAAFCNLPDATDVLDLTVLQQ